MMLEFAFWPYGFFALAGMALVGLAIMIHAVSHYPERVDPPLLPPAYMSRSEREGAISMGFLNSPPPPPPLKALDRPRVPTGLVRVLEVLEAAEAMRIHEDSLLARVPAAGGQREIRLTVADLKEVRDLFNRQWERGR